MSLQTKIKRLAELHEERAKLAKAVAERTEPRSPFYDGECGAWRQAARELRKALREAKV